jgi:3-hydroxyisobutyrate dehydrogenase-like beta-hydroxyacid dehydrogenase
LSTSIQDKAGAIGLIGVGLLGTALASRLVRAGFSLKGYDPDPEAMARLRGLGGESADTPEQVAASCLRLILVLPAPPDVQTTVDVITPYLEAGTIILDATTGDPEAVERTAALLSTRGVSYLDCEVGGSSKQAAAGDAILMCGGSPSAQQACEDIFAALSSRVFFTGDAGTGTRMKLTLNIAIGLHRAVLAESLSFAAANGIDPASALEILKSGPAYSKAMDVKGAKMLSGDFKPEARLAQHLKDVRLILKTGSSVRAKLPLSQLHEQLLTAAVDAGYAGEDNSAIIKMFAPTKTNTP